MKDYLDGVNRKNTKAWECLYKDYYTALCAYVYKIVGDESVSKDIVQDTLIGIWKSELKFLLVKKMTCYLYKAVYTNAVQYLRTEKLHHSLLEAYRDEEIDIADSHFALTLQEELTRQLRLCIHELPEQQRKIILLSLDGLSGNEIAEKLGISVNTVKTQKNRSFKYLRAKLGGSFYLLFLVGGYSL